MSSVISKFQPIPGDPETYRYPQTNISFHACSNAKLRSRAELTNKVFEAIKKSAFDYLLAGKHPKYRIVSLCSGQLGQEFLITHKIYQERAEFGHSATPERPLVSIEFALIDLIYENCNIQAFDLPINDHFYHEGAPIKRYYGTSYDFLRDRVLFSSGHLDRFEPIEDILIMVDPPAIFCDEPLNERVNVILFTKDNQDLFEKEVKNMWDICHLSKLIDGYLILSQTTVTMMVTSNRLGILLIDRLMEVDNRLSFVENLRNAGQVIGYQPFFYNDPFVDFRDLHKQLNKPKAFVLSIEITEEPEFKNHLENFVSNRKEMNTFRLVYKATDL